MAWLRYPLLAALVLTSATSAQVALRSPEALTGKPAAEMDADVLCRPFLDQFDDARNELRSVPQRMYSPTAPASPPPVNYYSPSTPLPPPPPPPPLPPPPPAAAERDAMVVSGSRARVIVPGFPIGTRENRERYAGEEVAAVQAVADAPVSTFGIDVDTGSYANVRRMLTGGTMPPQAAVRTEEMLNYFRYDYPRPRDRTLPFSISTDMTATPWNPETRLLRIGLRGYDVPRDDRPPANLVFLVDVSGSMESIDKLPLVQCSLALLAQRLSPRDRVAIVVYAGAAGLVLEPTHDRQRLLDALGRLRAGGSTAGAAGIQLAYAVARRNMIDGGINRVALATDGDFNVGVTDRDALIDMVERERTDGITLTTLGFGTGNYNEAMMEQIADHGNGNYAYIDSPREAAKVLDDELSSTLFTIARDVKIQIEFNPRFVQEYRLIGYENRTLAEQDFDNDAVDAGDIGAGHQVTALYEIVPVGSRGWLPQRHFETNKRKAAPSTGEDLAWLKLRYKLPGEDRSRLIEQSVAGGLERTAQAPTGDTAFAVAVAAYGQLLRGDKQMRGFSFADVRRLAQSCAGDNLWRREFLDLVGLAERQVRPGSSGN